MPADKITCPWCEKSFNVDQVEMAELWAERTQLAARLGQAWKLANEYCDSFRSTRDARITLKRRVAVLTDVARLWEMCVFEYDGKRYKTDQRAILEALHAVCSAAKTGFSNHNYLKRVLLGSNQGQDRQAKLLSSEGLTAEEEENRERARRTGSRFPVPGSHPAMGPSPLDGEANITSSPLDGTATQTSSPLHGGTTGGCRGESPDPEPTPAQIAENRRLIAEIAARLGGKTL